MNVVTANENREIIDKLDIDIIKRIDGQYELRELLSKFVNLYFNKMIIDITSIVDYKNYQVIDDLSKMVDPNRVILVLSDDADINSPTYISNLISHGFYNFSRNYEGVKYLYTNPNTYENVKHLEMSQEDIKKAEQTRVEQTPAPAMSVSNKKMIIGIANLTNHAGATSIVNMMVRQLNEHGYSAVGIEMFRQDLIFYHDRRLVSCMNRQDLENKLREENDANAIIIDLNEFGEADRYCDEILYLVEPSYVKLTKLLKKNRNAFVEKKGEKIVLNMSFVSNAEVQDFEYETNCRVFYNLPPLNDRNKDIEEINLLLKKLGFNIK